MAQRQRHPANAINAGWAPLAPLALRMMLEPQVSEPPSGSIIQAGDLDAVTAIVERTDSGLAETCSIDNIAVTFNDKAGGGDDRAGRDGCAADGYVWNGGFLWNDSSLWNDGSLRSDGVTETTAINLWVDQL